MGRGGEVRTKSKSKRNGERTPQIMPRNLLNLLKRNLSVKLPSANTHAETNGGGMGRAGGRWPHHATPPPQGRQGKGGGGRSTFPRDFQGKREDPSDKIPASGKQVGVLSLHMWAWPTYKWAAVGVGMCACV